MSDISLSPFALFHVKRFLPGRSEGDVRALEAADEGQAISVLEDGRLLGVIGARALNGEIWLWALLSDELMARPMVLHRRAKRLLPAMQRGFGGRRLHASARIHDTAAVLWLERLGFKRRGLIVNHLGTGRSVWRYGFDGT